MLSSQVFHVYQKSVYNYSIQKVAAIIKGKLTNTTGTGAVSFVNNIGAFFFEYWSYKLNCTLLDNVRCPGIVSTVRECLFYIMDG